MMILILLHSLEHDKRGRTDVGHDDGDQVCAQRVAVDVHLVDELGVADINLLQPRHAHILTLQSMHLFHSTVL